MDKVPTTPEEKLLVQNLSKLTTVFKELYKDNSNLKLVNASIYTKAYSDQSVLVKDLIYPSESRLPQFPKFKELTSKFNVSLEKFSANFWNEVSKKNDPAFATFLAELNQTANRNQYSEGGGGPTVYFPYVEEFPDPTEGYNPITSIATATADADQGWGELPFYSNGVLQYYTTVLVDDDYCEANPTHIIGVNGIEPEPVPTNPPPPPPPPPGVSRIYIGESICKNQYDRLISFTGNGGGSEMRFGHGTGYLQPQNGQITTFEDIVSVQFSRSDIKHKRTIRQFTIWDDDWVAGDLEQYFAIYEEDNTGTVTFNASLTTTLGTTNNNVVGTIGFSTTRQSQDAIIRQLKISRNSYFAGAFQDQAWGFSDDATFLPLPFTHGWPWYDGNKFGGADVVWTWPYNTF